jgi:hypothetical protein
VLSHRDQEKIPCLANSLSGACLAKLVTSYQVEEKTPPSELRKGGKSAQRNRDEHEASAGPNLHRSTPMEQARSNPRH